MKRLKSLSIFIASVIVITSCASSNGESSEVTSQMKVVESSPESQVALESTEESLDSGTRTNYCYWDSKVTLTDVEDPTGINPDNVYTCVCELLEQKPEQQTTFCADFGIMVYDMTWDKWDATGASGEGIYSHKVCEPSCADGYRIDKPVEVFLSELKTDGTRYYLMKFTYVGQKPFVLDDPLTETWDVGL